MRDESNMIIIEKEEGRSHNSPRIENEHQQFDCYQVKQGTGNVNGTTRVEYEYSYTGNMYLRASMNF